MQKSSSAAGYIWGGWGRACHPPCLPTFPSLCLSLISPLSSPSVFVLCLPSLLPSLSLSPCVCVLHMCAGTHVWVCMQVWPGQRTVWDAVSRETSILFFRLGFSLASPAQRGPEILPTLLSSCENICWDVWATPSGSQSQVLTLARKVLQTMPSTQSAYKPVRLPDSFSNRDMQVLPTAR